MDETQAEVFELREAIHSLKLKDAITRQELMRAERETESLKQQILKCQRETDKLQKDIKKDEKLLESQEENIVAAKLAISNRKKTRRNDYNLMQESIDREHEILKELKRRQDEMIGFLSNIRKRSAYLEMSLKDNKNANDIMSKMREFINYYEEHLASIDSSTSTEEILYQEEIKFYNQQYSLYEKELTEAESEQISEMKNLYELENRSNLSESDKVIYNKNVDLKTEQIAISTAEAILSRLREKLGGSETLGGVVNKLDSQISKHKKKVIHVDLS